MSHVRADIALQGYQGTLVDGVNQTRRRRPRPDGGRGIILGIAESRAAQQQRAQRVCAQQAPTRPHPCSSRPPRRRFRVVPAGGYAGGKDRIQDGSQRADDGRSGHARFSLRETHHSFGETSGDQCKSIDFRRSVGEFQQGGPAHGVLSRANRAPLGAYPSLNRKNDGSIQGKR